MIGNPLRRMLWPTSSAFFWNEEGPVDEVLPGSIFQLLSDEYDPEPILRWYWLLPGGSSPAEYGHWAVRKSVRGVLGFVLWSMLEGFAIAERKLARWLLSSDYYPNGGMPWATEGIEFSWRLWWEGQSE